MKGPTQIEWKGSFVQSGIFAKYKAFEMQFVILFESTCWMWRTEVQNHAGKHPCVYLILLLSHLSTASQSPHLSSLKYFDLHNDGKCFFLKKKKERHTVHHQTTISTWYFKSWSETVFFHEKTYVKGSIYHKSMGTTTTLSINRPQWSKTMRSTL